MSSTRPPACSRHCNLIVYRKGIRFPEYDYSSEGAYFVTVCTDGKHRILSDLPTVGADDSVRPYTLSGNTVVTDGSVRPAVPTILTPIGKIVEDCILSLPLHNHGIRLDKYVVMPNHIHLLLRFVPSEGGQSRPPLQKVMQSLKSVTTRRCWQFGVSKLWQRSFYDHVIRNETDYLKIWQYIEQNPLRWGEDIFFEPEES